MTTNEEITIVDPSFPVALYEMEKLWKQGYRISQQREPIYIAGLYEIVMVQEIVTHKTVESLMEDLNDDAPAVVQQEPAKRGPKPKVQK